MERGEECEGAFEGSFGLIGGFIVRGSGMGTENKQLGQGACENRFLWVGEAFCGYGEFREIGI